MTVVMFILRVWALIFVLIVGTDAFLVRRNGNAIRKYGGSAAQAIQLRLRSQNAFTLLRMHQVCNTGTVDVITENYTTVSDLFERSSQLLPNHRMLVDSIHGEDVELSYRSSGAW